ncbi:hypothetical protein HaLaN_07681 [Haematococcus lacustris]|uniref:Uncharacterized protein n=1 Tax=Haematococcus lacustris TaxID=44745 RepID=A0A699YS14_HAELA|nr:hypothetical protein HaLaN_07681 [Haematococcus lacustris]
MLVGHASTVGAAAAPGQAAGGRATGRSFTGEGAQRCAQQSKVKRYPSSSVSNWGLTQPHAHIHESRAAPGLCTLTCCNLRHAASWDVQLDHLKLPCAVVEDSKGRLLLRWWFMRSEPPATMRAGGQVKGVTCKTIPSLQTSPADSASS